MSSAYLWLLIFLAATVIPTCASASWAFCITYSAYNLNKQGDNIQPLLTSFLIWNQSALPCSVLTIASWSAYRFLRRQARWSGMPISVSFPQFVVICTVKDFYMVNKAEVVYFWNFFAFSMIQWMLAIWSLVPLPFLKPAWTYGISQFMYCWRLAWRNYFGSMWDECKCL